MTLTKAEIATWSVVAVALAGVVAFAAFARRPATDAHSDPAAEPDAEQAGLAPEKTTELLPEPAGELGDLPGVERSGRAMRTGELRGKFVVIDLIFTNCGGTCPLMTQQMAALQKRVTSMDDVRLASFSVDPERDTPEALAKYADQFAADKTQWLFFRFEPDVMKEIGVERLRLWKTPDDIGMHSSLFALLDREGRVRGLYSALHDPKWIPKLLKDLDTLRAEPAK